MSVFFVSGTFLDIGSGNFLVFSGVFLVLGTFFRVVSCVWFLSCVTFFSCFWYIFSVLETFLGFGISLVFCVHCNCVK